MNDFKKNMIEEQSICISCGFCCDGTLFYNALVQKGEKGNLPDLIGKKYLKLGNEEFFALPCSYFEGKCSIYDKHKPHICSAYRCQLLKNFSSVKIKYEEAQSVVFNAKKLRDTLLKEAALIYPETQGMHFRKLLDFLWKKRKEFDSKQEPKGLTILIGKVNLLETLLIKYFKSSSDFQKMVADE